MPFLSHLHHRAALISNSSGLSHAHWPKLQDYGHAAACRMVCLFTPAYTGTELYCLVIEAKSHTQQCSGWNWTNDFRHRSVIVATAGEEMASSVYQCACPVTRTAGMVS